MSKDTGRVLADRAGQASPGAATASPPSGDHPSRSKLEAFRAAQDKARKIAIVADRAAPAERAGSWLAMYGRNCVGKDAGAVSWTPAFAGACHGSKEAAAYIEKAIVTMLPTILEEARIMAEADMMALMRMIARDSDTHPKGGDGTAPFMGSAGRETASPEPNRSSETSGDDVGGGR
jgi:hypothetical protein